MRLNLIQLTIAAALGGLTACANSAPAAGSGSGLGPPSPLYAAVSDSIAATSESAIARAWKVYLDSKHGQFAANAGAPSPLWLAAEQSKWPMYDLAGFYIDDNATPEVVGIIAVAPNSYEIRTRFLSGGKTLLTTTTYAVYRRDRWFLGNALPYRTAKWQHETVGQISYFIEPGLTYNPTKARRAVAFADSVALAFGVPKLDRLDYYVTSSVDAALGILGAEFPTTYGPGGGFAKPVNRQLFSGIPSQGEEYRHELVHMVLLPLNSGGSMMSLFASEGVATWLGGTTGGDYKAAVRGLASYLNENPTVTLDSLMESPTPPQSARYAAGAVVCAMLSDAGGSAAVKQFLVAGPGASDRRAVLVRVLGKPWPTIAAEWRANVVRLRAG